MDLYTLSRRELQVLCKRTNVRANMTNAAMAEALDSLDLVYGINYETALVPAPTVTTRLAARRSVPKPAQVILRRSQRTVTRKASDREPKGEDDSTEVKERTASKMPQAKLTYETSEDDDLDEDEEWAFDDDSAEEDEVPCETHEENDTVFTSGIPQSFDNEMDTGPDQAALNELLKDLQGISLNMLRATYKEFTDQQIICSSVSSSCTA